MSDIIQEVKQLGRKFAAKKVEQAKVQGRKEEIVKGLERDFGVGSLEAAEKLLLQYELDLDTKNESLVSLKEKLEDVISK